MKPGLTMRVARPTDNLAGITGMYVKGLGFTVLAQFTEHEGFDGAILGHPQQLYHIEFTAQRGHQVGKAPTKDHLRQFEYQWLRALSGHYADFWQTTEDGLVFAAKLLQLELTPEKRAQLMQAYLGLKAWPDVPSALSALKEAGIRLAFLSNMTTKMLDADIKNAGLDGVFEHVLSTDQIRAYKPDPRAYQMAIDAFKLQREEIIFAAFAGWDAAGAKWFGYPTFWVNRLNLPAEELGVAPDAMGRDLTALVSFVRAPR